MIRVICIDGKNGHPEVIPPIEGDVYTVTGMSDEYKDSYYLKELPFAKDGIRVASYTTWRFIPLSTIDETELLHNRQTELV